MAIAIAQATVGNQGTNVGSLTVVLGSTTAAGSLLVAQVTVLTLTGDVSTVADDGSNTYSTAYDISSGSSFVHCREYYCANAAAAQTLTITLASNGYPAASFTEVSGAATSSVLDVTGTQNTASSSGTVSTSGSTTVANGIAFNQAAQDIDGHAGATQDSNYTTAYANLPNGGGVSNMISGYRLLSSTGTQSATINFNNGAVTAMTQGIATYKPPGGGGGATVKQLAAMGVG